MLAFILSERKQPGKRNGTEEVHHRVIGHLPILPLYYLFHKSVDLCLILSALVFDTSAGDGGGVIGQLFSDILRAAICSSFPMSGWLCLATPLLVTLVKNRGLSCSLLIGKY